MELFLFKQHVGPLTGVVIAVSKKLPNQGEYNDIVSSLGGDYRWTYDKSCTHFIYQVQLYIQVVTNEEILRHFIFLFVYFTPTLTVQGYFVETHLSDQLSNFVQILIDWNFVISLLTDLVVYLITLKINFPYRLYHYFPKFHLLQEMGIVKFCIMSTLYFSWYPYYTPLKFFHTKGKSFIKGKICDNIAGNLHQLIVLILE